MSVVIAADIEDANYASDMALAREALRAAIGKPAGSGPIRGLKFWNGSVYCMRDDADGLTATLWKSTASGWESVRAGMRPGGYMRAIIANFSGSSTEVALYGCDGKNRYWRYDGSTFEFGPALWGTESNAYSTVSHGNLVTPASGLQTFALGVFADRTFVAGDRLRIYGITNAANYMVGTFVSLVSNALTVNVSEFNNDGGEGFYHVCLESDYDRPYALVEHKNYLWLAYPRGQLITTDLGEPMTTGTTSEAFGIGAEITDLVVMRSDVLGIFRVNGVTLLYGSDPESFEMKPFTRASNCRARSAQEVGGNAIFVTDAGIQSLAGSDAFGDFQQDNLATFARRTEQRITSDFRCASVIRSDSQYRVYGADKRVLVMSWQSSPTSADAVEFMPLLYDHQAVCADAEVYNDEEYVFFGTDDGWVMRERVGTSFDGEPIESFVRTCYWHCGGPQVKKRMRKITLDIQAGEADVTINYRQDMDFQGPGQGTGYAYVTEVQGGAYNTDYWDEFFYDGEEAGQIHANVDGICRYMSLTVYSDSISEPHVLPGMHWLFTPLGLQR